MKARMEGQLADVGTKTESFQNEITNMQKFQESEGERQQAMWDENGNLNLLLDIFSKPP